MDDDYVSFEEVGHVVSKGGVDIDFHFFGSLVDLLEEPWGDVQLLVTEFLSVERVFRDVVLHWRVSTGMVIFLVLGVSLLGLSIIASSF